MSLEIRYRLKAKNGKLISARKLTGAITSLERAAANAERDLFNDLVRPFQYFEFLELAIAAAREAFEKEIKNGPILTIQEVRPGCLELLFLIPASIAWKVIGRPILRVLYKKIRSTRLGESIDQNLQREELMELARIVEEMKDRYKSWPSELGEHLEGRLSRALGVEKIDRKNGLIIVERIVRDTEELADDLEGDFELLEKELGEQLDDTDLD